MRMRKVYGQSREDTCPWCGKRATVQNKEGLLVCPEHRSDEMPAIRCTCGEWLDLRAGKFGPYLNCMSCGNISFTKGMELKEMNVPRKKKGSYVDGEFIISIDDL